jgi:hypothetical protein
MGETIFSLTVKSKETRPESKRRGDASSRLFPITRSRQPHFQFAFVFFLLPVFNKNIRRKFERKRFGNHERILFGKKITKMQKR